MLTQSCEILTGVGPSITKKLEQCNIHSIQDLLLHLPYRYQDRTRITPICDLRANDWRVISGNVCKVELSQGKRKMLDCYVEDNSGIIKLRFFNFNKQQISVFNNCPQIIAFGEARIFNNQIEMIHPEYQLIKPNNPYAVDEHLTPIYRSTNGLSQRQIRQLVKQALDKFHHVICDLEWMNEAQLQKYSLPTIHEAIYQIHNPPPDINTASIDNIHHPALKRLIMDELIAHQLSMQIAREKRNILQSLNIPFAHTIINDFQKKLPFKLTKAQLRVYQEISEDLNQTKPMLRLVQGDVGAGKTVLAAMAALQVINHGFQVALMAPTDILSEQHALKISHWFDQLGIKTYRLTGKMPLKQKREVMAAITDGSAMFVVGTHALFQKDIYFKNLNLIIIDEQHRFGVEQRRALQQKGQLDITTPHQLMMTATPIPRTLSMTHLAHLDISIIDELPPGRTPIITTVTHESKRDQIIKRLEYSIQQKHQIYWVCTLIDESEALTCNAAIATANDLALKLPNAEIGLIHGRLKSKEKDEIMSLFKNGNLDLLVATTVIEVGVDVPNASIMIIDNAERLGLSQLHQLRGRVGRGSKQSHCMLIYQAPLSFHSKERLRIMRETSDGFIIAEKDLELRGPGEVLGTMQTGDHIFKIADLQRDKTLLPEICKIAKTILHSQPELSHMITQRWLHNSTNFLQN